MSENEEVSSQGPSESYNSTVSIRFEDDTFSMTTLSYICLCSCACWAFYNCSYRTCAYLCLSSGIILCYGLTGAFYSYSRHTENLFWLFRELATIVPISSINAHVFVCDCGCSELYVLAVFLTMPYLLKLFYSGRNQHIQDIMVWSNLLTLGLKSVEHSSMVGLLTSCWQMFSHLLAGNSLKWLDTTPEIPFNLGLSGMCWCLIIIDFTHKET